MIRKERTKLKMGKRSKQIPHQRRDTEVKQVHEMRLGFIRCRDHVQMTI
jgi:hypothetical protein